MAKITLTSAEFANIVMIFLKDKLNNPDEVIEADVNELFNAFSEVLMRRGMSAPLLQCYMKMNPQLRVKYRLIRNVFIDKPGTEIATIQIIKEKRKEVLKKGTFDRIRDFVKKIEKLGIIVGAVKAGFDYIKK